MKLRNDLSKAKVQLSEFNIQLSKVKVKHVVH